MLLITNLCDRDSNILLNCYIWHAYLCALSYTCALFGQPLFPISPRDQATVINTKETVIPKTQSMIQAACDEQDRITPLSVILRDPKSSLDASALAAYPTEWRALDEAWDCVIRERLTTQPYASHTVVIDLDDANEILTVERLSELVCQITQFSRRFCPGER